ncbi:probable pterin-4-alpha-carbinolamine dehydratase, chloroplastic [Zea mays]|jgi:4a-hydroxytetrahydrobiopterin dehydratase|uniref:probable pterin-4-alpha-carbinolamine dehydratase, chloroplastic n=1 Tax=Zea mays TaxID=4577 RepID=UPI0002220E89|nr:probable pterin-4-alpha-carbinolamine dehydratase, chloroplastic [Zea mays]
MDRTKTLCAVSNLPLQPNAEPLSLDDARRLLFKVVGWRLVLSGGDGDGDEQRPARLQCVWNAALYGAGHAPAALAFEAPNQVMAKLSTSSAAGDSLTINDYIVPWLQLPRSGAGDFFWSARAKVSPRSSVGGEQCSS